MLLLLFADALYILLAYSLDPGNCFFFREGTLKLNVKCRWR